jgi:tRNA U34 5-methylaminomethyl-2-thiouridine-forming methyltransferase MnmC
MYSIPSTTFEPTGDGSKTLFHPLIGEYYHSKHGAVQESQHVFLKHGLLHLLENFSGSNLRLLEVGFGTGLNFLLSAQAVKTYDVILDYQGVEAYPLPLTTLLESDYARFVDDTVWQQFTLQYEEALQKQQTLFEQVRWRVHPSLLLDFVPAEPLHLLYYDAFSPRHQPEMWSKEVLAHVASMLLPDGVFVTYSITGQLRRDLQELGFEVEKLMGPPGKREMLRARKLQ